MSRHPLRDAGSVIYLRRAVASGLKQPTPRQRTSNPYLPVYLALQLIGCTARDVAIPAGGLLPRLFTLTAAVAAAVILCYITPAVAGSFPLGSMMLCVARTFLLTLRGVKRQNALLHLYVIDIFQSLSVSRRCMRRRLSFICISPLTE